MHPSHFRSAIGDSPLKLLFVIGSHAELVAEDSRDPAVSYFVTVTLKAGAMVATQSTLDDLEGISHSVYVSARRMVEGRRPINLGEAELMEPDGLSAHFSNNVVSLFTSVN